MREIETVSRKMSSIVRSLELALILQNDKPEIADDYRKGRFLKEIVSKYDLDTYQIGGYTVNQKIARQATDFALNGHRGGFGFAPFIGLLGDEEKERLAREHRFRNAQEAGENAYRNKTGIHGRTKEQKKDDTIKFIVSKGNTPWIQEEYDTVYALSKNPEYIHEEEFCKGDLKRELIAMKLNEMYHNGKKIRSSNSVHGALWRIKNKVIMSLQ